MLRTDFFGKELNIGDKVAWAYREPLGNKKEKGAFYVGTVIKLCDQQAKVIRDDGFETKVFYKFIIKIDG